MTIPGASTTATDLLLGAVALVLAFLLTARRRSDQGWTARLWAAALLFTSLAALAGGTYYGRGVGFPVALAGTLRRAAMAGVGLASFCFVAGAAFGSVRGRARRIVLWLATGQTVLYLAWTIEHDALGYAVFEHSSAMIAVLVLQARAWTRRRDPAAPWVIAGAALLTGCAAIQSGHLGADFALDEICHILQVIGIYCLFRGGRMLTDLGARGVPGRDTAESALQP